MGTLTEMPFEAEGDTVRGPGVYDMKGGIAAMVLAAEQFVEQHPDHTGTIALLITSDEEGPSINGTVKVVETLEARSEKIDWCLVGEPSSSQRLGDVVNSTPTVVGRPAEARRPRSGSRPGRE